MMNAHELDARQAARSDGETRSRRRRVSAALAVTCMLIGAPVPAREEDGGNPSAATLIEALLEGRGPVGGPFDLIDHGGRRRTDADFRGELVLIYFGYTHCPDVCPTELQALSLALDMLGTAGDAVQPLFITIDPERDTPSHLADYVTSFHPRLLALTGPAPAIRKVALAYKVYFARSGAARDGDYAVDHTGFIYLVGKDGRYLGFLPPGTTPEQIVDAVRPRLAQTE
jgi:cytochrome oxidase Cu insertion factor (SCO1/SenC/PrrC family)